MTKTSEVWGKPTRNILDALANAVQEDHCRPCGKPDECDGPCEKAAEEIVAMKKRMKGVKHA